jgi:N4-gp56 family major capsid protein
MTVNQTQYGDINQRTAAYAAVDMLDYAHAVIVLGQFGDTKPLPQNKADTVKFRRMVPFNAATVPLVEGVTPSAQKMSYQDVTAVLKEYGASIEISDKVVLLNEDPVLKNASELCGDQAGKTVEAVTYGVLKAGTTVYYANGAARNQVNTPISLNKLRAVSRGLMNQKAKKITKILSPSVEYGTSAVEAAYIAVTHTHVASDIRNLPGFISTAAYGQRTVLCPEEIGSVEDFRFVLSPDLGAFADAGGAKGGSGTNMYSTTGTSADVFPIIIIGQGAFGTVPLKGEGAIVPMVLNPGTPSKSDPLGQRGYVSWKTWFTAVILNDNWMARLEVAATDL